MPRKPRQGSTDAPAMRHIAEIMRTLRNFYKMTRGIARFDQLGGVTVRCYAKCRTCGRRVQFGNETTYRLALHFRVLGHKREDEQAIMRLLKPDMHKLVFDGLTSSSSSESSSDDDIGKLPNDRSIPALNEERPEQEIKSIEDASQLDEDFF